MAQKASIMVRKFQQLEEEGGELPESILPADYGAFKKHYCFFYRTLMHPARLAAVLLLPDSQPPKLRSAKVIDYHPKLWGQYPALLDGPQGNEEFGMAYEVQLSKELDQLKTYETAKYKHRSCLIQLLDATEGDRNEVRDNTFIWDGELDELIEGQFSLEAWLQQRMGRSKK